MQDEKTGGMNSSMEQREGDDLMPVTPDGEELGGVVEGQVHEIAADVSGAGFSEEFSQEGIESEPVGDEREQEPVEMLETPEVEVSKEPSKFGLFMRKLLRWAAGLGVVFIVGVLLMQFLVAAPLRKDLTSTNETLKSALDEAADLQEELDEVRLQNDALQVENEDLETRLTAVQADQQILRALADVSAARVALAEDDVVTAKAALSGTMTRLETLWDLVPADVQETAAGMIARLELVLEELDDDTFAAENDLEVLWTNLQALEASLFQ